jgi:hypothetical protein
MRAQNIKHKAKEEWKKLRKKLNLASANASNSLATKEQSVFRSEYNCE